MSHFRRMRKGNKAAIGLSLTIATSAHAQSVSETQSLAFGPFAASSSGSVTVGSDGLRTATGGVTLLTAPQFGIARAASFSVSNTTPSVSTFTITLPTSATLTRIGGTETMTVDTFVSNPAAGKSKGKKGFGTLSGGSGTFTVGARLTVGSTQARGNYTGSYSVTVTYP